MGKRWICTLPNIMSKGRRQQPSLLLFSSLSCYLPERLFPLLLMTQKYGITIHIEKEVWCCRLLLISRVLQASNRMCSLYNDRVITVFHTDLNCKLHNAQCTMHNAQRTYTNIKLPCSVKLIISTSRVSCAYQDSLAPFQCFSFCWGVLHIITLRKKQSSFSPLPGLRPSFLPTA